MSKKEKTFGILSLVFALLSGACDLLNPYFFAQVLNNINQVSDSSSMKWYLFGVMIGLAVASLIFAILYTYFSVKCSISTSANLQLQLFKKIEYLDSKRIDEFGSGSLMTRVTGDITQVQTFLLQLFSIGIKSIAFIIGGFILSFVQISNYINDGGNTDIWYITISYSLIIVFFIVIAIVGKKASPIMNTVRKNIDYNNSLMDENLNGNRMIRALNMQNYQLKQYKKGNETLRRNSIKGETIFSIMVPFAFFIINLASVIILVFAGIYAKNNPGSIDLIGVIMSFIQYFMYIMLGLSLCGGFVMNTVRAVVCLKRIYKIFDAESFIKPGNKTLDPKKPIDIEFKNVNFRYPSKNKTLENINIKVKQGEWLGIIGQTGSGKSSLINLIPRLYDVNEGEILFNGINIKEYDLDSLRDVIGVSLQEKVLIQGTIKSNIATGKPNATDKEIVDAAKWAEAYDFIQSKENKFDSVVEQRGNNFSGGQKQRLSIARAIIKKPKILIFDDSTSALDVITEQKIVENLHKHLKDSTVIIVSQKIKSIQSCNQIVVLDQGKIIQQGTHEELMKQSDGVYRKIADSQNTSVEG